MKTLTWTAWSLVVLGTCALAVMMVAAIILAAALLLVLSVAAIPMELLIKAISSFSPRFDAWTTSAYGRLCRRLRMTDGGPLTS